MNALQFALDRSIVIRARVATVFRYFTDSARFARWWGEGSTIDPRPGGRIVIRNRNGAMSGGEVLEIVENRRIVFTFGHDSAESPVKIGGSKVTVTLEPHARGTRLHLHHELDDEAARNEHVQGWRFQLSLFSAVISGEILAEAAGSVDRWFAMWSEADEAARLATLAAIATREVDFRDQYSATSGPADLSAHVGAAQRFMPGMTLTRHGDVRQCQGTAVVDWVATGPDGSPRGRGVNVFDFDADGKIERVVGLWSA